MSRSSHEERKEREAAESQHEQLYGIPLIILSSSEDLEPEPQPAPKPQQYPHDQKLIQQKKEADSGKLQRINSIVDIWDKTTEQQKEKEMAEKSNKPPKKQSKQKDPKYEQKFPKHQFLPIQSLDFVLEQMKKFSTHPAYREKQLSQNRQAQRQQLVKYILLARQQAKTMKERTETEQLICGDDHNLLNYVYHIAKKIERSFFNQLYNKMNDKKPPGYWYTKQIKLVLREFKDRNNLQLRRRILSNQHDITELVNADEQSIMCEKTRQLQDQKRKQLIRESSKNPFEELSKMDQQPSEAPLQISHFPSFVSATEIYEGKAQNLQEKRKREKADLIAKNKIICKKTYSEIRKAMKDMKERIDKLRKQVPNNHVLQKLRYDFKVTFDMHGN